MSTRVWASEQDPGNEHIYEFLRSTYMSASELAAAAAWNLPMHIYGLSERDTSELVGCFEDHYMTLGPDITMVQIRTIEGNVVKTVWNSR